MESKIIKIISQITSLDANYLSQNLSNEKQWDSFRNVEIIFALESEFEITYSPEEMADFNSVKKIISITERLINEK